MAVRGYTLGVDWSGNTTYAGALEDASSYVQRSEVTMSWGRDLGTGATLATTAGALDFALNNHTRVFSPENTASPISGKIEPGRPVQFRKLHLGSETLLYQGTLDQITVDATTPAKTFHGGTLDAWGKPGAEKLSTPLYSGIRTGQAINYVLDEIGWPATKREIDDGATYISWWWEEGNDAATAVQRIVDSEGPPAIAFVEGGIFKFRDRHHRYLDPRSLTGTQTMITFDMESGVADFNATSGCTFVTSTAQFQGLTGIRSGLLTVVGTPGQAYTRPSAVIGVNPGRTYRATMWVRVPVAGNVTAALDWSNAAGYIGGQYPSTAVAANTWTQLTVQDTAPSNATRIAFGPTLVSPAAGTQLYLDNVVLEQTDGTQGVFTHIEPAGSGPYGDYKILRGSFDYDYGHKMIRNAASFTVEERKPQPIDQVWSTEDAFTMVAGEVLPIEITTSDPFYDAQSLVSGVDWTTAVGSLTTSLSRTSGAATILTLTAVGDTTVTFLQLRARSVAVVRSVKVTAEDTASVAKRGRATWEHEPVWANKYDCKAIADRVVSMYGDSRDIVTFKIAGVNDAHMTKILGMRIGDRITVRNDTMGLNTDMIVEWLEHTVSNLQIHVLTVKCVPVDATQPSNALTFGVAGKGFNDGAFGVAGIDSAASVFRFDTAGQGFNQGQFAN